MNAIRDSGILLAYRQGVVTGISVVPNGTSKKLNSLFPSEYKDVGVHLNLTEGKPLSLPDDIPSLVNQDGRFMGKLALRNACNARSVNMEHVVHETTKQMQWFMDKFSQVPISADSHQHCHMIPALAPSIAKVWKNFNVSHIRMPVGSLSPCVTCSSVRWLPNYSSMNHACAFIGYCNLHYTERDLINRIEEAMETSDSMELMVHPGFRDLYGSEFDENWRRLHELLIMLSPTLKQKLDGLGIELVPRHELFINES